MLGKTATSPSLEGVTPCKHWALFFNFALLPGCFLKWLSVSDPWIRTAIPPSIRAWHSKDIPHVGCICPLALGFVGEGGYSLATSSEATGTWKEEWDPCLPPPSRMWQQHAGWGLNLCLWQGCSNGAGGVGCVPTASGGLWQQHGLWVLAS